MSIDEYGKFIVGICKEHVSISKARVIYGLPTKRKKQQAGVSYEEGGVYVFTGALGFLYVGECRRFYDRLTPQHHRYKSVGPDCALSSFLITIKGNTIDARKCVESALIHAAKPVFNGASDKYYLNCHEYGRPKAWAVTILGSCEGSYTRNIFSPIDNQWREDSGVTQGFFIDGHPDLLGVDCRKLSVDHDVLKTAITILQDYGQWVFFLDDTKIAMRSDDFETLFPNIFISGTRKLTAFQSMKLNNWEAFVQ